MAGRKNVTLSDVAAAAGVSLSTASKALSGVGRISEATRSRIVETAERLDFRPNALAQSFALGRSRTIGVLTQNAIGTWSGPILVGVTSTLGKHEHAALHYDAHFDVATLNSSIRKLQARRIDGLVIIGEGPEHTLRSVTDDFAVPVAYVFASTDDAGDATFVPDEDLAGRIAGEHLLDLGRRHLAHISVPDNRAAARRAAGFTAALRERGVEPVAVLAEGGGWREAWGVRATTALLDDGVEFDGLFCANDQIAQGAQKVLAGRGVRVPEDVALVGVDNWEGVVTATPRHLTSVDLRLTDIGAAAAEYVLAGTREPGRHAFPGSLVVSESSVPREA